MTATQPIKIAIVAMGGEGGGVLADWIVDLAEHNDYLAQTTSVPGVAQRTGTTLYYVELYPRVQAQADGGVPVLALMPLPGDVDVVLASELMEAGRAIQRGLVSVDRTMLVTSTHRVYSMTEKTAMGDGRVDGAELLAQVARAARRFVGFDMAAAAVDSGSVIGAVLFGALAGTGVLPFDRAAFEATIERGGVGVAASRQAFAVAFERARAGAPAPSTIEPALPAAAPQPRSAEVRALLARVGAEFPPVAQSFLTEGVRRLLDYQDPAWAGSYLDRMARVKAAPGGGDAQLLTELARHLALWMSWEDTIRVADLKTRGSRFERVRGEVRLADGQLLAIDEYLHPRVQEIAETLPVGLGRWLLASGWPRRLVERFTTRGRVVTTSSLPGFLLLYATAGMKRWRRSTLRFAIEQAHIEQWLRRIEEAAAVSPELATEIVRCQRLVKGYGDTHERGLRNYETLMAALRHGGPEVTPAILRELRDAALADERGEMLQAALGRHGLAAARTSFT
ncbi:MAG: indolepyruvate oxidoreductase subunit B [Lautropia sp. SCN 69-89]|nr:MAG: indolepyruvate oxidoreductase subunit B [Lautropia sp. SCN 69-89]